MTFPLSRTLPLFALLCCAAPLAAQTAPRPRLDAAERSGAVRIDGRLDEDAWEGAAAATDFVASEPVEGDVAQEQTEVRVLYDDAAIYVGARLHDSQPERIARQLVRRDEGGEFDFFEVSLSPSNDRRTGYRFRVSAAGVQSDSYLFDDTDADDDWDAVWESATERDADGWTAELRIPLSQFRFTPADSIQGWGINFGRRRVASNERSFFALESRTRYGRVSVFGRLEELRLAGGGRRLEVRPYALARGRSAPSDDGDPFFSGREAGANAGVDLTYGVGSAFTLNATLNPDFGQVEVDPAVVNLSAFETFFPERRPFFVEDARIFDFDLSDRASTLFYSRRVGREPSRRSLDGAAFVEAPTQSAILGAAKLTGRTGGGWSIGALGALTGREQGRALFLPEDSLGRDSLVTFLAEPLTGQAVFRARRDLRGGASQLGAIATTLYRDLPGDGSFDFLPSTALSAGVDGEHTWSDGDWAVFGFLAGSRVSGSERAITSIQRSPNHYFQRPDAVSLRVDSAATSITGAEWQAQLEKRGGGRWTGAAWLSQRTPGFEVNDLGFFRGEQRLEAGARAAYKEIEPGAVLRSYRFSGFTFQNWRRSALRDPLSPEAWGRAYSRGFIGLGTDLEFLNYWSLDLEARYRPETLSGTATRGGPLLIDPSSRRFEIGVRTDSRKPLAFEPDFAVERGAYGKRSWSAGLEIGWRPASQIEVQVEPSYRSERDPAQYVATTDDTGFAPTFGRRYLFGNLDRRTASLETRLNVAFSPTLTLQLYAEPFVSAGDYVTYKVLERPSSFDFARLHPGEAIEENGTVFCAGGDICRLGDTEHVDLDGDGAADFDFGERDFRVRSLRGNAVLRWEYRPGSTLFLVWQQEREFRDLRAERFGVLRDTGALFGDPADNVLILKVNYWLNL